MPINVCAELVRNRVSRYRWFARRYRDEAAEELYNAEDAHQSDGAELETVHREGVASALRIARFFEEEAENMEKRFLRDEQT